MSSPFRNWLANDRSVLPALCFGAVYFLFGFLGSRFSSGFYSSQWVALAAVIGATVVMIAAYDRRVLPLGLVLPPRRATLEFLTGVFWALLLALAVDTMILLTGDLSRTFSASFSGKELLLLLIPAALHEELVFRGYAFQKLLQGNREFALLFGSVFFMCAHMGNRNLTTVAMLNIFLAGLVLSLAFVWRESLWVAIGMHLGWNVAIGPILGHEISGFVTMGRVFSTVDRGPAWITGGDFGIEGSLWTTGGSLVAIVVLLAVIRKKPEPGLPNPELISLTRNSHS